VPATLNQLDTFHTPIPTSKRSILLLSSHLRLGLPNGLFPSEFTTKFKTTIQRLQVASMVVFFSSVRPHFLQSVRTSSPFCFGINKSVNIFFGAANKNLTAFFRLWKIFCWSLQRISVCNSPAALAEYKFQPPDKEEWGYMSLMSTVREVSLKLATL